MIFDVQGLIKYTPFAGGSVTIARVETYSQNRTDDNAKINIIDSPHQPDRTFLMYSLTIIWRTSLHSFASQLKVSKFQLVCTDLFIDIENVIRYIPQPKLNEEVFLMIHPNGIRRICQIASPANSQL